MSRIAIRALGEFLTHVCAAVLKRFEGELDIGFLFVALLRQADLGGAGAPIPISINALSRSLARPFETVRRLSNRLCDLGLAERNDQGIFIPHHVGGNPLAQAIRADIYDNFVRLIVDQARLGYPLPAAQERAINEAAVERGALDLVLLSFEFGIPPQSKRDWQRPLLYLAVMTANARPFTFDPVLALRYADITTPPPDSHRSPVSTGALARSMGMPYTTVRRHLEALVEAGQLVRAATGGYLVNMAWMQSAASAAAGIGMVVQLDRVLRQVAAAGFPFDDPASAYRRGAPILLEFG